MNTDYYVCDSFLILLKEMEKYLLLREVLTNFSSNI
jgi:hypothetical protein